MKEKLPSPLNPPVPEPEVDQLADWIVRHEELPSTPLPTDREPSPETIPPQDQTEIYFERRHEVKDEHPSASEPNVQPMIPIAQVIQTRSLLPQQPTPEQAAASRARLRELFIPSGSRSRYAAAILQGFGTALVLITITAIVFVVRVLVQK
jgi:hypothetical protein